MKKFFKVLFTSLLILTGTNALAATPSDKNGSIQPINRIVAVVNQEIITEKDLNNATTAARSQFQQQGIALPDEKTFKTKILDGLILQKLQLQVAAQNNIKVSDEEIDATIQNIAKQNRASIAELKQKLQAEHISFDDFRNQLRDQLIIRNLQQQAIANSIKLSQADLDEYKKKLESENEINDYHIIDYLITLPAHPTPEQKLAALNKAQALVTQLKQGKTPATPDAGLEINDMGYQPLADLPDLFSVPLAKMGKGQVSDPLLAGNGYHVLKLIALKKESKAIPKQQVQQLLFQKKFQKKLKEWLDNLRKQAYVKTYLDSK